MAALDIDFPFDLMKQLERIANVDLHAPQIIDAALPILEKGIKAGYDKHRVSGDLANSIKISKAKKNQYGHFGVVSPSGVDGKGVSNKDKAIYLEYGAYSEKGVQRQPATPVIIPAVNSVRGEILERMQQEFDKVVDE